MKGNQQQSPGMLDVTELGLLHTSLMPFDYPDYTLFLHGSNTETETQMLGPTVLAKLHYRASQ